MTLPLWALSAFGSIRKLAAKIPWQVWAAIGAALLILWFGQMRYSDGVSDERERWVELAQKAEKRADKASTAATVTVQGTKARVEAENQAAIDAAKDSDDPLADTLRNLP